MSKNPGYYQNSYLATPPVGSIMRYLGTNDPDGWIICNGTARTNNQDGRYNALNSLGIGSGGSGTSNYTPPDLLGKFLIGASSTYPLKTIGGNANITLDGNTMPSHSHGMQHQHYVGANWGGGSVPGTTYNNYGLNNATNQQFGYFTENGVGYIPTSTPLVYNGSNPDTTNTKTITDAAGGGTSFSIIPPYRAVNYIIKY